MGNETDVLYLLNEIGMEYDAAAKRFPPFNSAHEGFAVLAEEVDELWDEVKKNPSRRNPEALRKEAIQVAAMALRFVADICDGERSHV